MVKLHKKSKRQTTKLRAKIEKKVREHNRKVKKEKNKNPNAAKKKRKDPGIPNSLPFKETILKEAEDRKNRLEEERQRQKEKRKKDRAKLLEKKRSLDGLVKDAQRKTAEFERKQQGQKAQDSTFKPNKNVESSLKTFYKEFRKVVDAADVILEVLDARDPLGSRCQEMEDLILSSSTSKRLVLVLNKIDLVPRENVEAWLKYLKNEFPVVAFKASTQSQNENLGRSKVSISKASEDLLQSSQCLGSDILMKLLANYCRNKDIKTVIRVGVVGFPNTGKSSIINSLKRSKTCNVGSTPGVTRQMQEVQLDKHIRLLDSPGVVMATSTSDTSIILKNCVKLESLEDLSEPIEAILKRCNKQQMMLHYCIPDYSTPAELLSLPTGRLGQLKLGGVPDTFVIMMLHYCIPDYSTPAEFLSLLARRLGRLKKGGVPDTNRAGRTVLQDWNSGRITYYTHPPETREAHVSSEFVAQMGKEFDIDALLQDEQKIVDSLEKKGTKHMLVESLGPTEAVVKPEDLKKLDTIETNKKSRKAEDVEDMEDEEEEEDEEMSSEGEEEEESGEEAMEGCEEEELSKVTVSMSSSRSRSRTSSQSGSQGDGSKKKGDKSERLNPGLPQLNKARKMDFKKMKKQRRRRDKVAGELSDALTSAFNLSGAGNQRDDGEDGYDFSVNF